MHLDPNHRNSPPPNFVGYHYKNGADFRYRTEYSDSKSSSTISSLPSFPSSIDGTHQTSLDMTFSPHEDPDNPFAFTSQQLVALVSQRNFDLLERAGGVSGVATGLHSDITRGISNHDSDLQPVSLHDLDILKNRVIRTEKNPEDAYREGVDYTLRYRIFGSNRLPQIGTRGIIQLMWISMQDKTLILLMISAAISLSVGIYEDLTTVEYDASGNKIPGIKWLEGATILLAVFLVVVVSSINNYQKEKQFRKLNSKKENRSVHAIRSGHQCTISVYDIQVGDVLSIESGDIIPADGVFIQGHNVKCDESAATGESGAVRKARWQDCLTLRWMIDPNISSSSSFDVLTLVDESDGKDNDPSTMLFDYNNCSSSSLDDINLPDPFIISGSKVLEGIGTYIVTAVGVNSFHGKTLMALREEDESTPLEQKLDILAESIAKLGLAAASFLFVILSVRCGFEYVTAGVLVTPSDVIAQIMHILIMTVTVIVVAVPEGLPLTVTLAFAYASQRMLKDNNLVRVLAACETMGNATSICSDKTGTLTQNNMSVVTGTFGSSFRFSDKAPDAKRGLVDLAAIKYSMPLPVRNFVNQAIAVNSTAFMTTDPDGNRTFVGSKTEAALLDFSQKHLSAEPLDLLRSRWPVEQVFPCNSLTKAMGIVIRVQVLNEYTKCQQTVYRLHIKGASEVLIDHCSRIVSMHASSYSSFDGTEDSNYEIETRTMTETNQERTAKIIHSYSTQCLRTIVMCFRDFTSWPTNQKLEQVIAAGGLTFLGIVGIEDPLRPGVTAAVEVCRRAGVCVRMVTGDHMLTAKSIARQCGIYTSGTLAMDGPSFRKLSREDRLKILPGLRILARSSPEDKRLLVEDLKHSGEIVAVTGDGTNDSPALKAADIGFSMGLTGTEVAKEASSIILMDDNFSSIVHAIAWGRCVNDSVKKFLQFQLTANITALVLTIVSVMVGGEQTSALTAVQLLWVNLIMDTFGALALATDPPTPDLLKRSPEPRTAPLIDRCMWKMILGQSIYQISVILTMLYTNVLHLPQESATLRTIIFTTFVFCQIFNQVNCRRIDSHLNVTKNITKNDFFIIIFVISVFGQVLIVECGGAAFQTTSLNFSQWMFSIAVGFFCIPLGAAIRLIPEDSVDVQQISFN